MADVASILLRFASKMAYSGFLCWFHTTLQGDEAEAVRV
jgi:hypothetical protein